MWKLGDVGVWLEADLVLCGYGRARECWILILSFREFVRIMYMSCIEQCHRSSSVSGEHGKVTFHIGTLQTDRNAGKRRSILGFRDIWGGIDGTGNICDAFGPWLLWRWLVNGAIGGNKEVECVATFVTLDLLYESIPTATLASSYHRYFLCPIHCGPHLL